MPEPTLAMPTVVGMSEDHQLQGCKSMPTQSSLTHRQGVQKLPFLWKPGKKLFIDFQQDTQLRMDFVQMQLAASTP
jgi:hypothetical protein